MNILAINNYSLKDNLEDVKKNRTPAHHCWGVDYLLQQGHQVETINYSNIGKCRLLLYIKNIYFCLRILRKVSKVDVCISFANPIIGFLAFFKYVGLLRNVRLYTLVHHYSRHPMLFCHPKRGYEKVLFLSKDIMELYKIRWPQKAEYFVYIEWGADLKFYQNTYEKLHQQTILLPRILSNGKTNRDLLLAEMSCTELNIPLLLITDILNYEFKPKHLLSTIVSGKAHANAISYKELLDYMVDYSIHLVPIIPSAGKGVLCGLTSVIDALALGCPIIISDNSNISIDIEYEKIGLYYHAGDKEDLKNKIKYMIARPDFMKKCGINARKYAEKHSYSSYCKKLYSIIVE